MKHVDFLARWLVSIGTALCVLWGGMSGATAMTEEQARAIIAPWYRLFNLPVQGDMRKLQEEVLTSDYQSCAGYLPNECWGREASIKIVGGFATSIPDLKFQIHEVLVSGDRVIVRGEVTGTPSGVLFGAPHTGKSFGSWPSTYRQSATARFPRPTTWRTGSAPWDSCAPSRPSSPQRYWP